MADRRIGYVLKMYPRLSETFVLNEILALEATGCEISIFSLRCPTDACAHEDAAKVRAPVTYIRDTPIGAGEFARALAGAAAALDAEDATISPDRPKHAWTLWQASQIARLAQSRSITHLHAHFATEATTTARLAARIAGIGYSFTAHAKDIFHETVEDEFLRRNARDASAVVTVSDFNVAYLRGRLGPEGRRVRRVYNGLDLREFPFADDGRDPALIVGVGRLVEKKGFADLISACAILARHRSDLKCVIIGGGDLADALSRQIAELNLSDRIALLGPRPREEVRRVMAKASVLAAPCVVAGDGNRDGVPMVLLEAMALGTPCVSTPVTGIPEIIRHRETGLLVPERDPPALAQAIAHLIEDRRFARRVAVGARALIERAFDLHRNTRDLREVFGVPSADGAA